MQDGELIIKFDIKIHHDNTNALPWNTNIVLCPGILSANLVSISVHYFNHIDDKLLYIVRINKDNL